MKNIIIALLSAAVFTEVNAQTTSNSASGNLTVVIKGFKNNSGSVSVALFNKEDGFPKSPEKAVAIIYSKINDNKSIAVFQHLPAGEYAVSVYHDENNNKKMDRNIIGMPKEGVGASNNARGHLGPPKYQDAKFAFTGTDESITINIVYL
jgi:uncharacterized protein (DUF2141 family)